MRAKALVLAVFLGTFSYIGCAAPTAADGEDVDLSADALERGRANTDGFVDVPSLTAAQRETVLARYAGIPHDGVREALYQQAILYYDANLDHIRNKAYLSIVDFQKQSGTRRFFVLDMKGGPVKSYVVAHGKNSDPDNDGVATDFSNEVGSGESSLGYYVTAEVYDGAHGESLRLDGLSSTNSNVRERAIVIHAAEYVKDGYPKQGRSLGCLAFSDDDKPWLVQNLKEGSIILASK